MYVVTVQGVGFTLHNAELTALAADSPCDELQREGVFETRYRSVGE